jgi:NAD(P)-dependent dehydrogenase (short-subunit alcohol dehydrogenase family)
LEFGATVVISSSRTEKVKEKVAELQRLYPSARDRISGHACNLADEANLESNIRELLEKTGTIDHIVHTAGDSLSVKPMAEIDMDFVKKAGQVRFFSILMLAKHAPKYLNPGPKSSITLTSGLVASRPVPGWTVIGAYAAGAEGMTRGLALELKPIRVNIVAPGPINTAIFDSVSDEDRKAYADRMPTGQIGEVADIVESYLSCIKDHNLSGTIIHSDGGANIA